MVNVFLSRPSWVNGESKPGLKHFLRLLDTHAVNYRTLGITDYPTQSPLDEVIRLMDQCDGAIILGYPQITITNGLIKDQPMKEVGLLATEWNQIEAGLAYAKGLPLFVIHHTGVTRGIFDRGAINSFIYEVDFGERDWPLKPEITGAFVRWKQDVLEKGGSRGKPVEDRSGFYGSINSAWPDILQDLTQEYGQTKPEIHWLGVTLGDAWPRLSGTLLNLMDRNRLPQRLSIRLTQVDPEFLRDDLKQSGLAERSATCRRQIQSFVERYLLRQSEVNITTTTYRHMPNFHGVCIGDPNSSGAVCYASLARWDGQGALRVADEPYWKHMKDTKEFVAFTSWLLYCEAQKPP